MKGGRSCLGRELQYCQEFFQAAQQGALQNKMRNALLQSLSGLAHNCNVLLQDLPMDFAVPTVFLLIVYWMTGLRPTAQAFFENYFTVMFLSLVRCLAAQIVTQLLKATSQAACS